MNLIRVQIIALFLIIGCSSTEDSLTEEQKFNLRISAEEGGSVSSQGGTYSSGSRVTITAIPNSDFVFNGWSNGSTENPITISITSDLNLTANFIKRHFPLTINIQGEGTVLEEIISSEKSTPTEYKSGTTLRLTALPTGEWNQFQSWSGDISSAAPSIELIIEEPINITVSFVESNIIVKANTTEIINSTVSSRDALRSFYNVSGVFPYSSNGQKYMFYPGAANWIAGQSNNLTKNDIPPMPSQILRKVDDRWEFFKTDNNANFWGARNFKTKDNYVVIGDGNEIGPDGPTWQGGPQTNNNWNGDLYFGEISNEGNINWTTVNSLEERIYTHGVTIGDINGDGLLDVGAAPNAGNNTLKLYLQEIDGSFTNADDLLTLIDGQPFTLDFSDLDNDGLDEIITANYGDGNPVQDLLLNNIRVYKYNPSNERFEIYFRSDSPSALFEIGLGATSILTADFDSDEIKDIAVAREDAQGVSYEIWKGYSDGTYTPHFASPIWEEGELAFREFRIFDVNDDSYPDIILRPFHYGSLYRNSSNCEWNVPQCNGVKLNTIIQINNGDGTFGAYETEDLIIEGLNVDNLHPYMEDGILHFLGTYPINDNEDFGLLTYDIGVRILN